MNQIDIDYIVQIWKEEDKFVAHAMPLDVLSWGQSQEESRTALAEAVQGFLETIQKMGTLAEVLEECGYRKSGEKWMCPEVVTTEKRNLKTAV